MSGQRQGAFDRLGDAPRLGDLLHEAHMVDDQRQIGVPRGDFAERRHAIGCDDHDGQARALGLWPKPIRGPVRQPAAIAVPDEGEPTPNMPGALFHEAIAARFAGSSSARRPMTAKCCG